MEDLSTEYVDLTIEQGSAHRLQEEVMFVRKLYDTPE